MLISKGSSLTEQALAEAFKKLVSQKSYEKITISDIAEASGFSRITFYHHFKDKEQFLGWIVRNEIVEPVRPIFKSGIYKNGVLLIFKNFADDKAFYKALSQGDGKAALDDVVRHEIYSLLFSWFTDASEKTAPELPGFLTPHYLAEYYARSISYLIEVWIREGMPSAPDEMSQVCDYIAMKSMDNVMEAFISGKPYDMSTQIGRFAPNERFE